MSVVSEVFTRIRDQRIQEDVSRQIAWQPEIESKDISVKVVNANVALTGSVHTFLEKWAAERAAKSVVGVLSVANDIEVRPTSQRSDPEIARDVVETLRLHTSVPEDRLMVTVQNGFVTLEGTLTWDFQRRSAERAAEVISGVRGVINAIGLAPAVSSQQVKEKIEEAWKRTTDLDARRMSVVSNGATVSLYGSVHSWSERDLAERAAWQAPGVREVSNHLLVSP